MTEAGKWRWSHHVAFKSSESSVESIFEAPIVITQTLSANVGRGAFGPNSTIRDGSGTHTIVQGRPTKIVPLSGLIAEANPSAPGVERLVVLRPRLSQSCAAP